MSEPEEPATGSTSPGAQPGRRSFLRTALGAGAAGAAGVAAGYTVASSRSARPAAAGSADSDARLPGVPFHGQYQAGILPKPQQQTAVVSFNITAEGRGQLAELFQTLTDRARFLTAGGTPPPAGITGPPTDSGVLGPVVTPDGLTVTVGVGASLFDDRYGLAGRIPSQLTTMKPFPNDILDPAQCQGDLSLQLCAGSADTVLHALRDITKNTRGGMQVLWRIDGFSSPPRPAGTTPRNLMGFMDGIANPAVNDAAQMDSLVWVQPGTSGEPSWTAGGSYVAIRLIRMFVEFWDRVSLTEQEQMFGRRRDNGAPLDANSEFAIPALRCRPHWRGDTAHRAHPAGQPADPADRVQPHSAACLQLRPRRGRGGQPRHGAHLHLLPAGHQAPVRGGANQAH